LGAVNPYQDLPDYQFWKRAVAQTDASRIDPVLGSRWKIGKVEKVATAGSCFAQHISRMLQQSGFNYFIAESAEGLQPDEATARQFGVFSARYGNLYTARQLVQLFDRAYGHFLPTEQAWLRLDGRYVDPFRPQIEPEGFASVAEVDVARARHLKAVRRLFEEMDVFVFTLGLTECWESTEDGMVYPLAPGVVASGFDPEKHRFVNFGVREVLEDIRAIVRRLRSVNPEVRILFTVSPVPLIATFEDRHVLVSTVESKSILRAAIAQVVSEDDSVDYFPSYEIITGQHARGAYFAPDLRSVTDAGVAHVMRLFMKHYTNESGVSGVADDRVERSSADSDARVAEQQQLQEVVCDEEAIERHRVDH
jgi:hypothetical protein